MSRIYSLSFSWCIIFSIIDTLLYTLHRGIASNTALPMVTCLFVGCMSTSCLKRRSPVKAFKKPLGNSLVLFYELRALFASWDATTEQALRSWTLSMPATIRTRLDDLSLFPYRNNFIIQMTDLKMFCTKFVWSQLKQIPRNKSYFMSRLMTQCRPIHENNVRRAIKIYSLNP